MTGDEHYRKAERLAAQADTWEDADTGWKAQLSVEERIARRMADLAAAQVHATLAHVAATAQSARDGGMSEIEFEAWDRTTGVPTIEDGAS